MLKALECRYDDDVKLTSQLPVCPLADSEFDVASSSTSCADSGRGLSCEVHDDAAKTLATAPGPRAAAEPSARSSEPPGRSLEPLGRSLEPLERSSEPSEPSMRSVEPLGRSSELLWQNSKRSEPSERGTELLDRETEPLEPVGRSLEPPGRNFESSGRSSELLGRNSKPSEPSARGTEPLARLADPPGRGMETFLGRGREMPEASTCRGNPLATLAEGLLAQSASLDACRQPTLRSAVNVVGSGAGM